MTDEVERVEPSERLRIAVLGDFDGVHTRSWVRWFIERGHDVHCVSYYAPREPVEGATVHALHGDARSHRGTATPRAGTSSRQPIRGLVRIAHALRYRRAGLGRVVRKIAPDVFHAHFVVEHGFYGAVAGFHPYVVTAWGSDVLVEPDRDPVSKLIAKWTLRRADAATSNNRYMADQMVALGAPREKVHVITLGADRYFLDHRERSVNLRAPESSRRSCVISTRAHEPLYNVSEIMDAFALVAGKCPDLRLVVAHGGSLTPELTRRAKTIGAPIDFPGFIEREAFRAALHDAEVFVSVPSSDGTSVALLQAMAAGCFPIVSDLPTQRELIDDGVNGLPVPLHDVLALAGAIERALADPELRRRAADANRELVETRGLNENEMRRMEELYRAVSAGGQRSAGESIGL